MIGYAGRGGLLPPNDSTRSWQKGELTHMSANWHYRVGDREFGPVSATELRRLAAAGELGRHDHIRKDGMVDWVVASSAKGLFGSPSEPPNQASLQRDVLNMPESTSTSSAPSPLSKTEAFYNNLKEWVQPYAARGGLTATYAKLCIMWIESMQFGAGLRLPDGSAARPTRSYYASILAFCLLGASVFGYQAYRGLMETSRTEFSEQYQFKQDGNDIDLTKVQRRVRAHTIKSTRKMHEAERAGLGLIGGAFLLAALWAAFRCVMCRPSR